MQKLKIFEQCSFYWDIQKVDNTIRYLGVELEDALLLSEGTDC
ncbi:hypothetical protein VCRA213O314_250001 [Vibrio crassostreae]|nr:hypothetical protein VCRA213O314_250001 [Vibrio crassostreae]